MSPKAPSMQDTTDTGSVDPGVATEGAEPAPDAGAFRGTPGSSPASSPPPARRGRVAVVLPWLVAVLAIAAAAFSTWQWQQLAGQEDLADSARATALEFVDDLANWDASDGLTDEIDALRAQATGPFLDEIDQLFGGDELTSRLRDAQVSASGEVEEAFVQDLGNGTAEVFVVVSVTYQAPDGPEETSPVAFPAEIILEQGERGWLVRRVTLPNQDQIGQLMAPTPEQTTEG